jgi:hypothetical protein
VITLCGGGRTVPRVFASGRGQRHRSHCHGDEENKCTKIQRCTRASPPPMMSVAQSDTHFPGGRDVCYPHSFCIASQILSFRTAGRRLQMSGLVLILTSVFVKDHLWAVPIAHLVLHDIQRFIGRSVEKSAAVRRVGDLHSQVKCQRKSIYVGYISM